MKEKRVIDFRKIEDPSLIKDLSYEELNELSSQLREEIIDKCSINGGHLSSNLGTVELTVALFNSLNLPKDKVIFDVGHQAYTYKLLSGRNLDSLRQKDGIDGFQKKDESKFDCYEAGHSSTSIGAGMGFSLTRDLEGEDYKVVCVVGDASIANGVSFEALNNLNNFKHQLLIILNDNEMSISNPVGGFNKTLQKIRVSRNYVKSKNRYKKIMKRFKFLLPLYRFTSKLKDFIVSLIFKPNFFEYLGVYYYGIVDGHNIKKLTKAINFVKDFDSPVILHVKTKKGKGYKYSEGDKSGKWHSISSFNKETGELVNKKEENKAGFAEIYSSLLDKAMEKDKKIISINPAMSYGSSLDELMKKFPQRALDVGISEEHSLVFASGIASNSFHPYVSVYSTFLQRSYDQISHDVARMDLPVTIMVDHCGLVGRDGETHQGIYDYAYLSSIPNMTIAMAKDAKEANKLFNFSLTYSHPLAIRYPVTNVIKQNEIIKDSLTYGQWDILSKDESKNIAVITFGPKVDEIMNKNLNVTLVNAIFNYPINNEVLKGLLDYKTIVIYDPYGCENGFANTVSLSLYELGYKGNVRKISLPLEFIKKGSIEEQEKQYKVDLDSLIDTINEVK